MKWKRGSSMVEGAIVIPIIILISISTIFYAIFQYENFWLQLRNHQQLLQQCDEPSGQLVCQEEKVRNNAIDLGGLVKDVLSKEIRDQKYVINFEKSARCYHVL